MYVCDTCRREYAVKKSLKRHIREKHMEQTHYPCAFVTCRAKFIRRSYLITHLKKVHGLDKATSKNMASTVKLTVNIPLPETRFEEVSDNEDFFDNLTKSPNQPEMEAIFEDESIYNIVDNLIYSPSADNAHVDVNNSDILKLVDGSDVDENDHVDHNDGNDDNVNVDDHVGSIGNDDNVNVDDHVGSIGNDTNDVGDINFLEQLAAGDIKDGTNRQDHNGDDDGTEVVYSDDGSTQQDDDGIHRNVIIISSDDDNDDDKEVLITSINITLTKTENIKHGEVKSVTRSASVGYSENLVPADITGNLKNIFDTVQKEFQEYASYYHQHNDK